MAGARLEVGITMQTAGSYVFPAVRGIQAGREYYVSMCPLRMLVMLFQFDDIDPPELRAQRLLNRGRVPEIARYIVEHADSYVFSAITASIDADVRFEAAGASDVGTLHVPLSARFIINDGQHRRAAIEQALRQRPALADETIAVVFFHDRSLARCQQMFADLNRYSIRSSSSLNVLYDHRDEKAATARAVLEAVPQLKELVDMERSSLSKGSRKLFTLSALHTATTQLLTGAPEEGRMETAVRFWSDLYARFPSWEEVRGGKRSAGQVRNQCIHAHGVALHALGRVGNSLVHRDGGWNDGLTGVEAIDWRREAPEWEGRATAGGNLVKSAQNVILTGNLIKSRLGIGLSPEEQRLEDGYNRSSNAD
ncbi:DNA sulfur modification protein DndB [Sphingomonas sp.]|jgi:DNA sulfur modification protein DndB|uniref:DNA sulfur modification protein DndB n=1 Tax=Sphingomonas sp. TaxID=28214 RepID=UPI002E338442|nr:DNA sulfur modification protein DndB [Sphingomonas sp.]HEX4694471.1 DNA sulfur modification protein DndB [Sphingomonas sp.]